MLLVNLEDASPVNAANDRSNNNERFPAGNANSGEEEGENHSSFAGNRWPRQETLALLKIRSDMDSIFRESSLKGPLWEDVSRKLTELGYNRSAKKCKEKFENVFKYHKRTREGRNAKTDGKSYRFFDQLQALENLHSHSSSPSKLPPPPPLPPPHLQHQIDSDQSKPSKPLSDQIQTTVPWINAIPVSKHNNIVFSNPKTTVSTPPLLNQSVNNSYNPYPPPMFPVVNSSSHLFSSSTSSSTASDEEEYSDDDEQDRKNNSSSKKRKLKEFFKRLTKEVIEKQEKLQMKFLETIERREEERHAQEETRRSEEMARINEEHETLIQERSAAAAKDSAIIAFLRKISDDHRQEAKRAMVLKKLEITPKLVDINGDISDLDHHHLENNVLTISSTNILSPSRWPRAEVDALISIRTSLDLQYHENNGPKGALWEDISIAMRKNGYNRNAKRCKEKWENINKYFKKVKESNKTRPDYSKTCPYFHQLDALYRDKNKNNSMKGNEDKSEVERDQKWLQPSDQRPPQTVFGQVVTVRGNAGRQMIPDEEDGCGGSDGDEDEDEGSNFEIVANRTAVSMLDSTGS